MLKSQGQLDKSTYQQEVKKLVDILKLYQPEKIILFGSAAKGKIHPDSDIDVCLIKKFKKPILEEKRRLSALLWKHDFNYLFGPDMQLYQPSRFQSLLQKGDPFVEEINQGKIVYEK